MLKRAVWKASGLLWPAERPVIAQISVEGRQLVVFRNEDVGRRLSLTGRFEKLEADFFRSQVRQGDVCFDLGANTGFYTTLFSQLCGQGRVHAFEPSERTFYALGLSVSLNRAQNVVLNRLGVSYSTGEAKFSVASDGAYSSMLATGRKGEADCVPIRTTTLDDYVVLNRVPRVDVVKIDVEGAERAVIEGGTGLFTDPVRKPRLMMVELFNQNLTAYGTNCREVIERLMGLGYEPMELTDSKTLIQLRNIEAPRNPNVFFIPRR